MSVEGRRFILLFGAELTPGPEASILSVTSGVTDNVPDFSVDLASGFAGDEAYKNAVAGDFNDVEVQINQTGSYSIYFTDILVDPIGDPATITGLTTLADGTHNFRQRLRRTGSQPSAYSNVVAHTIDAFGPVFTSSATANNAENSVLAHTLSATDATAVTFAIRTAVQDAASLDHDEFEINGGTTLRWSANGTRNREIPSDTNTDNAYVVVVRATDANAHTTDQTITITVTNVNEAPTVANVIPNQSATDGVAFSFQFNSNTFADVDVGDTLTYSATLSSGAALPAWLTFTPSTRTFSGTPATGDIGTITVRVTATDAGSLSVTDDFDIVVSSAANRVLDLLSTSAARAYSVRKLRAAYAGSAIRVRRSNDNAEADIGFDGSGNLDTAALASHVGANSGFIRTWYDQSGNGDNLVQATSGLQWRIVNAGTNETKNSLPVIKADGTDDVMAGASAYNCAECSVIVALNHATPWPAFDGVYTGTSGVDAEIVLIGNSGSTGFLSAGVAATIAVDGGGNVCLFGGALFQADCRNPTPQAQTAPQIGQDRNVAGRFLDGWLGEAIAFPTELSAGDRTTMRTNQKTYWGTA